MAANLDLKYVRSQFPSLANGFLFGDNAGGSQVLQGCIDRLTDYLVNTNAQLGANYSVSAESTRRVNEGKRIAAKLIGADEAEAEGSVVFGHSTTVLLENLARALENDVQAGDEIIVTGEHEANVGPWKKLAARRGATLKHWHPTPIPTSPQNPYAISHKISDLLPLISGKTRLVAFSACSNILGTVIDVEEVIKEARARAQEVGSKKVEFCVDCVAFAPHRRIKAIEWDVDYFAFSFYKVYAPHVSILYARPAKLQSLTSQVHHFLSPVHKLQPGGPGYELPWSTTAVYPYFLSLCRNPSGDESKDLDSAFAAIQQHEKILLEHLLGFLEAPKQFDRGVRVVGQGLTPDGDVPESRVPTVSFVVVGQRAMRSQDVVEFFDKEGTIGIRHGHCYGYTVIDVLQPKIDMDDGVVRISLVHYNTIDDVERIILVLEAALA